MARRLDSMLQDQLSQSEPPEPLTIGHVPLRVSNGHTSAPLISLPGNELLPWNRRLTRAGTARLKSLGFAKPTASPQQWQIPLTPANDGESIPTCAEAVVIALIEAYSLEPVVVACSVNLTVEQHQETLKVASQTKTPDPDAISVELQTHDGVLRLHSDGTASSDGTAVLDDPVSRWVALGDGRLSVELAHHGSSPGINVAFCPDTAEKRAILSVFCPSDETRHRLQQRLALLEHTMLEAIRTGEIPSAWEWAAINQLTKTHRMDAPTEDLNTTEGLQSLRGWESVTRLRAANQIWGPLDRSMWADKLSELHGDQLDILRAMQRWLHSSPWKDQFDFIILRGGDCGEPVILRL